MAPLIPKRRRVERSHELRERPPKVARRDTHTAAGSAEQASRQASKPLNRNKPSPESYDDESSDSDDGRDTQSKQAFGALLGALNVPTRRAANDGLDSSGGRTNGRSPAADDEVTPLAADTAISNHEDAMPSDINGNGHVLDAERDEDSDTDDGEDPFNAHFAQPDGDELAKTLTDVKHSKWQSAKSQKSSARMMIMMPESSSRRVTESRSQNSVGAHLKQKLRQRGEAALRRYEHTASLLAPTAFDYTDVLYGGRTAENAAGLRSTICLHALNHVMKTRDAVIKNNARLARDAGVSLELRDQGFTRPKVLILLETRQMCVKYMETMTSIFAPEQQENKKRFEDAFVRTEAKYPGDKPLDFRELFEGNDDNEFRLGVKFTRKTIKYYSQFYNSDIILASPLGLRRAIKAEDPKHTDSDFLSSIELFVIDQADAMLMQNFEHVEHVFDYLNFQPKEAHGCDFSRVRQWYLDGNARHLRQTIILSAFLTPELNSLFSNRMQNVAGKSKVIPMYDNGTIMDVGLPIRQTFTRYTCRSPEKDPDERFKHFVSSIIPLLIRQLPNQRTHNQEDETEQDRPGLGALIFIPSYFDFIRIRNHFSTSPDTANLSFGSISEYTEVSDARRTRSHFLAGRQSVMLYTGRAHHFHRYRIRGVKRVLLYGIPENPLFYPELVGDLLRQSIEDGRVDAADASARVLFSKYDGLVLERIVGSRRAGRMLKDGDDTFEFT